jgi:integrase
VVAALKARRKAQLEERVAAGPLWRDTGYVFTTAAGGPLEPRNVVRSFKAALTRAKLPSAVRFHDLRHSAASLLGLQGVSPRVVMETLGHSDIRVTMNLYGHVFEEAKQEAAAKMDALLSGPRTAR